MRVNSDRYFRQKHGGLGENVAFRSMVGRRAARSGFVSRVRNVRPTGVKLKFVNYRTQLATLDAETLEHNRDEITTSLSGPEGAQLDILWPEVVEVLANNDGQCLIEIADVTADDGRVTHRVFVIPLGSALVFPADSSAAVGMVVQHDPEEFEDSKLAAALQFALESPVVHFKQSIRFA